MSDEARQPANNISSQETLVGSFSRMAPWTLSARLIVMVVGILVTAFLTRVLSKSEWSEYSLLRGIWFYVWWLGMLGLSEAALRFTAELSVWGDVRGFRVLLSKALSVQMLAVAFMFTALMFLRDWLDQIFGVHFGFALVVAVIAGGLAIFKETLRQVYVAAYRIKLVAMMSVLGALVFPASAYVYVSCFGWGVGGGIGAQATAFGLMVLVFAVLLPGLQFRRTVSPSPRKGPEEQQPVTNYRIFRYAGAIFASNIMALAFGPTVVLLLVGYFLSPVRTGFVGAAGIYDLAALMPREMMYFLILAVMPLLQAMLTKAYAQDRRRLPELLRSYHRFMILMLVPSLAVGLLFIDKALAVLAADRGVEAGVLAMFLLPINVVAVFQFPISAGLKVLEKAQWLILPQIASGVFAVGLVVIFLWVWPDYPSIVVARYIGAIGGSIWMVSISTHFIGGLYFPFRFLGRCVLSSSVVLLLYPLRLLWPVAEGWAEIELGHGAIGSLAMLVLAGVLSVILLIISARFFHLIGKEEIRYFREAKIPGIKVLMKLLVRRQYRPD